MKRWIVLAFLLLPSLSRADEGMWLFDNLPREAMASHYGFVPDQAWLDHLRLSSLFLGGCSASFVSPDGLVMTNHHCVEACLLSLSTVDKKDYRADGFLARTRSEEKTCPAMEASQLLSTRDVTTEVRAATGGVPPDGFTHALDAVTARLESECVGKDPETIHCQVVDLYHGGQYALYRYRRFKDLRLVFAPETSIAAFGGDPDNFNFPRYDLDVSFLRAWEGGAPVSSPEHLSWKPDGPSEGEMVFVSGHPGSTDRLLTVAQLEYRRDVMLVETLQRLAQRRGMLHEYAREGGEQKRLADQQLEYVENGVKVYRGEHQALIDPRLLAEKRGEEDRLKAAVAKDRALAAEVGDPWVEIVSALAHEREQHVRFGLVGTGRAFATRLFSIAQLLVRAGVERAKPDSERLPEFSEASLPALQRQLFSPAPFYPDLAERELAMSLYQMREELTPDDPFVRLVLGKRSPESRAHELIGGCTLADPAVRRKLWDGGSKAVEASTDPMVALARSVDAESRAVRSRYEREVEGPLDRASEKVARVFFAVHGKTTYPDATGTLRLSFGKVEGWTREDGLTIPPFTVIGGVYDRATGEDPFALPARWLEARLRLKAETRFDFVTDNDIVGGNSGSPMLDKGGRLVGIAFDGNIESLGGSFWFDERVNRAVGVDSAAILEALQVVYRADVLAAELTGKTAQSSQPGKVR